MDQRVIYFFFFGLFTGLVMGFLAGSLLALTARPRLLPASLSPHCQIAGKNP